MANFSEIIKSSDVPVLVDFYADWCQPCHMMAPILKNVAAKMDGQVRILKVNVDKNQKASAKYQIRSIPTLILFHKGKVLWRKSGVIPEAQLMNMIRPHAHA